jgi:signal peptidase I
VTDEAPNPYTAPTASLADGAVTAEASPASTARKPSRFLAVVAALFTNPLSGAGFHLLGRARYAAVWTAVGVFVYALLISACWAPLPKIVPIVIAAMLAVFASAVVGTAITKPAVPPKHATLSAVLLVVVAVLGNTAVRLWVVEAFQIPSGGMVPALVVGDHIFVRKGRRHIARGDVIVFEFPMDRRTDYVKRVVAIGGDTIEVRDGVPSINGVPLDHEPIAGSCTSRDESAPATDQEAQRCTLLRESNAGRAYTVMLSPDQPALDSPPLHVPPGHVFVMGDNRDNSYDSRKWGMVPADAIKGVATVTWWSKAPNGPVRWSRVGHGVE